MSICIQIMKKYNNSPSTNMIYCKRITTMQFGYARHFVYDMQNDIKFSFMQRVKCPQLILCHYLTLDVYWWFQEIWTQQREIILLTMVSLKLEIKTRRPPKPRYFSHEQVTQRYVTLPGVPHSKSPLNILVKWMKVFMDLH